MHPIYTARQLYWFKDGTRSGPDAALMKPWVASLNDDDIVAISAYWRRWSRLAVLLKPDTYGS